MQLFRKNECFLVISDSRFEKMKNSKTTIMKFAGYLEAPLNNFSYLQSLMNDPKYLKNSPC